MAFKVKAPAGETFFLDKTDAAFPIEEGEDRTFVVIREATQAEDKMRTSLNDEFDRVYRTTEPDVVRISQNISVPQIIEMSIYLTMADSNITENGSGLFKFKQVGSVTKVDMKFPDFQSAIGRLPAKIVDEIYEKVLAKNKDWDPKTGK
jgi:hypothetical protein